MACKKCPDGKPYNKALAELSQDDFQTMIARNGGGMILQYTGQQQNKIPVKGPASGKTYRTQLTPDGVLLFNVHPDDADILKQRTRKGVPLFVEFQPPQQVVKAEPVKASAPKLPENDVVMDDIWADVPEGNNPVALGEVKYIEEKELDIDGFDNESMTFDTLSDFNNWFNSTLDDDNSKFDLEFLIILLTAERSNKNRKGIVSEINKALNG